VAVNFTSGTIAAVAATVLTQPTDVIRTRMQLGFADQASGAAGVLRSVLARDGASALMAGVAPRVRSQCRAPRRCTPLLLSLTCSRRALPC